MRTRGSLAGLMAGLAAVALGLAVADARSGRNGDAASGSPATAVPAASSARTSGRGQTPPSHVVCPRRSLDPGPRAPEDAIRALRKQVPRLFDIVAYWHRAKLTAKNTDVVDIRPLRNASDLPGIRTLRSTTSYYANIAKRLCGRDIVSKTWLAILYFQDAPAIPFAYYYAFLSRTADGWKLWYHRQAQAG